MTRRYAEGTEVSVEKSQGEIRALIAKIPYALSEWIGRTYKPAQLTRPVGYPT